MGQWIPLMVQLTRPIPPHRLTLPSRLERQQTVAQWEIHNRVGNLRDAAWWRWMPGVTFTVKWPVGKIFILDETDSRWSGLGPAQEAIESADPNDHYRPFLEENLGRQRWDWDWRLCDDNVAENRLTIKVRNKHAKYATIAGLRWS